jgi:hypothetical protein
VGIAAMFLTLYISFPSLLHAGTQPVNLITIMVQKMSGGKVAVMLPLLWPVQRLELT